jgi:D-ribitol-5-phosphate cytidylyltransferase
VSDTAAVAVIFAGGVGSRMRSAEEPKQFICVDGKPILVHTLERFQAHPEVAAIYLVTLTSHIDETWRLVHKFGIDKVRSVVPGGTTAQASIRNGLDSALEDGVAAEAVVLIHDGVRPLINADLISRNIATARQHGNAISAIPCFETIARSVDGASTVESVTRREEMHVLQAPQTFRLGLVAGLNARAVEEGLLGSFVDQAQLARHYGHELHMVTGLRGNVKLTTDLDLLQFRALTECGYLSSVLGERP